MSIQNPHDRFFRESFGRLDVVRNYLEEYLPSQIVDVLALDTLTRQDGSFIDEEMQAHQTDMLYEVRLTTGERATLYFLFEHKSYPDKLISLQLLRYMVRFWEQQVKDKVELMPIIPLVIYHGEKAWRVPRDFLSLFHPPEALQPYLPQFNYLLSDFSHLSNEPIRGTLWLRVSLEVLKGIFSPRLEEELPELMRLLFQLDDGKGCDKKLCNGKKGRTIERWKKK